MTKSRTKTAEATETTEAADVFDREIAARAEEVQHRPEQPQVAEIVQSVADATRMPETRGHATTVGKRQYKKQPDPFGGLIIDLSNDPKGPKARFLRSNDNQAMLLQFSENPGKEITDQLKEAGFRWERRAESDFAKGAWVIDLQPGREWQNHAHADQVFQEVVNQLRAKNGMEPYVSGAAQSAG